MQVPTSKHVTLPFFKKVMHSSKFAHDHINMYTRLTKRLAAKAGKQHDQKREHY
jgi:hypothetical protein